MLVIALLVDYKIFQPPVSVISRDTKADFPVADYYPNFETFRD
jgi:hypothetical protein